MPFLIKNVRQIPGLSGSAQSRFQNLDGSGGTKSLAGQPLYGSGSGDAAGGAAGGNGDGQCGQPVETGGSSADGQVAANMVPKTWNSCFGSTGPNFAAPGNRASSPPPCETPCCNSVPGGGGGGVGGGGSSIPC